MKIKAERAKSTLAVIILISIFLNLSTVFLAYEQSIYLRKLEDIVLSKSATYFTLSNKLTEIERLTGYLGFIHHFKNYVIRRENRYYLSAEESYQNATQAIREFKQANHNPSLSSQVQILEETLDTYYQKLESARSLHPDLSVSELDEFVKVNDQDAGIALSHLRRMLREPIIEINQTTKQHLTRLGIYIWLFSLGFVPISITVSIFIIRLLRQQQTQAKELAHIMDLSPDAIVYVDPNGHILNTNKKACTLFRLPHKQINQPSIYDLIADGDRLDFKTFHSQNVQSEHTNKLLPFVLSLQGKNTEGDSLDLKVTMSTGEIGGKQRTVCIFRDMEAYNTLKKCAEHDDLTGLHNRRFFEQAAQKGISRAQRAHHQLALLMIDIDSFKWINDNMGHSAGDLALCETALFLGNHTREYDLVGRWGGDEFAILCPEISPQDACAFAERLRSHFAQKNILDADKLTLSIGMIHVSKPNTITYQALFEEADTALYESKTKGKNCVTYRLL
ncbi:GGDEF domain-containing protein [Vibrio sp. S9_S30]|uniref:GGDEF domain-containing protein n=1 Tax=Vibrio sp. S9_S30 TaxID=2720226 RepID=UPI0016802EFA|nr:GGDEF domain-containing protein [Vibrio sp. S9_S30]MBD1557615.1 GGDEF domain-containing protein [Vibrio sp. S9_S30]